MCSIVVDHSVEGSMLFIEVMGTVTDPSMKKSWKDHASRPMWVGRFLQGQSDSWTLRYKNHRHQHQQLGDWREKWHPGTLCMSYKASSGYLTNNNGAGFGLTEGGIVLGGCVDGCGIKALQLPS